MIGGLWHSAMFSVEFSNIKFSDKYLIAINLKLCLHELKKLMLQKLAKIKAALDNRNINQSSKFS
jgi:hypothetical protein